MAYSDFSKAPLFGSLLLAAAGAVPAACSGGPFGHPSAERSESDSDEEIVPRHRNVGRAAEGGEERVRHLLALELFRLDEGAAELTILHLIEVVGCKRAGMREGIGTSS